MNKYLGTGRLTADPELRYTQTGKAVASFTIAINEGKDRPATFVDCVAWDKNAENIANPKFFEKGKGIEVEGRLQNERWEHEGQKRSKTSVVVERWGFPLSNGSGGSGNQRQDEDENVPKDLVSNNSDDDDSLPF